MMAYWIEKLFQLCKGLWLGVWKKIVCLAHFNIQSQFKMKKATNDRDEVWEARIKALLAHLNYKN